jgi:ferredoxin
MYDLVEKLAESIRQLKEASENFELILAGMRERDGVVTARECLECGSDCDAMGRCVAQCYNREIVKG